jgi:hypothetical protein
MLRERVLPQRLGLFIKMHLLVSLIISEIKSVLSINVSLSTTKSLKSSVPAGILALYRPFLNGLALSYSVIFCIDRFRYTKAIYFIVNSRLIFFIERNSFLLKK